MLLICGMNNLIPILSITGSDPTGGSGIQADVKTISALGGYALTAVTAITVQNLQHIVSVEKMETELIMSQITTIFDEVRPNAIKIGLIADIQTIIKLSTEIGACQNIVLDPGFLSSRNEKLIQANVMKVIAHYLFPKSRVLILKCNEAETLLNVSIHSVEDMKDVAMQLLSTGTESVLLQGGHCTDGFVTDVFISENSVDEPLFFSSPDISGWNFHGVVGNLSSAIATLLGKGEDLKSAVVRAHDYIRNLVVYSVVSDGKNIIHNFNNQGVTYRNADIYNKFITLVAANCLKARNVQFYADKLNITPRYLSQITHRTVGNMPKKIIDSYIIKEIEQAMLSTSLTIQELAYKFGFASQVAFCKFFKAQKGISPTDYRIKNH